MDSKQDEMKRKITIKTQTEIVGTDMPSLPNETLSSGLYTSQYPQGSLFSKKATSDSEEIEKINEEEKQVITHWGLFDKIIYGRKIPIMLIVLFIGLIFYTDNFAGKLLDWKDLWWTVQKSIVILLFFVITLLIPYLFHKVFK